MSVRLTPKASTDDILGLADDIASEGARVLRARVRALPENNKANRALEILIAKWLGVAKSSVSVSSGAKSRLKTVTIVGQSDALEEALVARFAPEQNN